MGSNASKDLRVLCYQHHRAMSKGTRNLLDEALFLCNEPGCLIRYTTTKGYFLDTQDKTALEQEIPTRVKCSVDQSPMYLAESQTQAQNYRLWKCPQCGATRTNEGDSNGLEKKAGA